MYHMDCHKIGRPELGQSHLAKRLAIPDSEEQLLTEYHWGGANKGGNKAIFYSVWSHQKGMGRQIINTALSQLVLENKHERYITLSPKTEMAKKFHESNGAKSKKSGSSKNR